VFEPDRQIELLRHFWGKLEKDRSLLFFYCNHGNPLDESLNRILLGVSRITQIGHQLFFGKKLPKYPDQYPIWSRCITHDFENQGFRLPYHEYLKAGHDPKNILCLVPEGAMLNFSYVAEHVNDDIAVGALERLLQSVQAVKDENKVPGDWDRHLLWLNDVLSEVWQRSVDRFPASAVYSNTSAANPARLSSVKCCSRCSRKATTLGVPRPFSKVGASVRAAVRKGA
jgi:exodeoxyribonuclease V alpha subunit